MNFARTLTPDELNTETFRLHRLNDHVIVFTYTGTNITGATIKFTVVNRATGVRVFQLTVGSGIALTTPASGIFTVTITDTNMDIDASDYDYDVEITLSTLVTTLAKGLFRVLDIVSDAPTS